MPEYLEAHDAVLLCGPYKLNQFMADSGTGSAAGSGSAGWNSGGGGGQTAVLTLGGHQLLQSTARNFMVHVKYIPSFTQVNLTFYLNYLALLTFFFLYLVKVDQFAERISSNDEFIRWIWWRKLGHGR